MQPESAEAVLSTEARYLWIYCNLGYKCAPKSSEPLESDYLGYSDSRSVALHFRYVWTLASGKVVEFECVDVFELAADRHRFSRMTIIYDTAPLRADFETSRNQV